MEKLYINLDSPSQTLKFGKKIGESACAGDVICLDGDLGAGKTTLTQAIAVGLEVPAEYYVTSPSFNIFHEYPGRIALYHMDFYRLNSSDEILEMGLDEYFFLSGLTVIEWSERAVDILPENRLSMYLKNMGNEQRQAVCHSNSGSWQERIARIAYEMTAF